MIAQLDLFDNGAGHTAPRRWRGTGEHNGGLICEDLEDYEYKGRKRRRGRVVGYEHGWDKWLLQPGAIAAGYAEEWKEMGE